MSHILAKAVRSTATVFPRWLSMIAVSTLVICSAVGRSDAQIFKWTDKNGKVHIANSPPNEIPADMPVKMIQATPVPLVQDGPGAVVPTANSTSLATPPPSPILPSALTPSPAGPGATGAPPVPSADGAVE